jgi:hypothetical protein
MTEAESSEAIKRLQNEVSTLAQIKSRRSPESLFHRGPRAIGLWVAMYGLFYEVVIRTHGTAIIQLLGNSTTLMELRPDILWLIAGMGGYLSGLRSLDKKNGVV